MAIDVDPDWWKTLFDEVYLITDARSVDDSAVTRAEIDVFTSLLPMQPDDRILDLCGGHGRHALELCRRGFRRCTVLDYSRSLLDIGAKHAEEHRLAVSFRRADARSTGLPDAGFDHVMVLGNSLGYLPEPDDDLRILAESRRVLAPGGGLLLDVSDGDAVRSGLSPLAWHEIGKDVVVCRRRELDGNRIRAREMVLSKSRGLIRDRTYCIRLYGADEISAVVKSAGFEQVKVCTGESAAGSAEDVGCMTHRLLVRARKP